jgi:hypothetical protein
MSACCVDLGRLTDHIGALARLFIVEDLPRGLRHCAREAFCGRR